MSKAAIRCLLAVSVFGLDADKAGKCEGTSLIQSAKRGELLSFDPAQNAHDFNVNKQKIVESDSYEMIQEDDLIKEIKMEYVPGIVTTDGNFYMTYKTASLLQTDGTTAAGVRGGLFYQMDYSAALMQTNSRCPGFGTTYSSALLQQQDNQTLDATEGCEVCDAEGTPIFDHYTELSNVGESDVRITALYTKFKMVLLSTEAEKVARGIREACRDKCQKKFSGKSKRRPRKKCKKKCDQPASLTQQTSESSTPQFAFYTSVA